MAKDISNDQQDKFVDTIPAGQLGQYFQYEPPAGQRQEENKEPATLDEFITLLKNNQHDLEPDVAEVLKRGNRNELAQLWGRFKGEGEETEE